MARVVSACVHTCIRVDVLLTLARVRVWDPIDVCLRLSAVDAVSFLRHPCPRLAHRPGPLLLRLLLRLELSSCTHRLCRSYRRPCHRCPLLALWASRPACPLMLASARVLPPIIINQCRPTAYDARTSPGTFLDSPPRQACSTPHSLSPAAALDQLPPACRLTLGHASTHGALPVTVQARKAYACSGAAVLPPAQHFRSLR